MSESNESSSPRVKLIREAAVLQLKLMADGLRDAILIPVSLVASIIGIIRGGEEPDREFKKVLKLGRRSERWINLFGQQPPLGKEHPAGSLDTVLEQAEAVVLEKYNKGRTTAEKATDDMEQEREQKEG